MVSKFPWPEFFGLFCVWVLWTFSLNQTYRRPEGRRSVILRWIVLWLSMPCWAPEETYKHASKLVTMAWDDIMPLDSGSHWTVAMIRDSVLYWEGVSDKLNSSRFFRVRGHWREHFVSFGLFDCHNNSHCFWAHVRLNFNDLLLKIKLSIKILKLFVLIDNYSRYCFGAYYLTHTVCVFLKDWITRFALVEMTTEV